jgi:hypothetical protein
VDADVIEHRRTEFQSESDNEGVCEQRLVTILSCAQTVLGDVTEDCSIGRVRDHDNTTESG